MKPSLQGKLIHDDDAEETLVVESELEKTLIVETDNTTGGTVLEMEDSTFEKSWTYYFFFLMIASILLVWLLNMLGQSLFWTDRVTYIASLLSRFLLIIIVGQWFYPRVYATRTRTFFIVNGWLAFTSGLTIAIIRFILNQSTWTLINVIIEPVDMVLLSLLASLIVRRVYKLLTKQNYATN